MPASGSRRPTPRKSLKSRSRATAPQPQSPRENDARFIPGQRAIRGDDGRMTKLLVNLAETPLGWLARRKGADGKALISLEAFQAGERLREDFTQAGLSPHLTLNWDRLGTPIAGRRNQAGAPGGGIFALDAQRRFHDALAAVGPGLSDLLIAVCCHLQGLETAEQHFRWPARSGKVVLAIALDRLARHYGFLPPGPPARRAAAPGRQAGIRPSSAAKTAPEVKSARSG